MTTYATKEFIIAVLPVATGFTLYFAHGAFAYNVWPHLKIKAKKSDATSGKRLKRLRRKKRFEKILWVHAHINPFHNLDVKSDQEK